MLYYKPFFDSCMYKFELNNIFSSSFFTRLFSIKRHDLGIKQANYNKKLKLLVREGGWERV